MLQTNWVWGEGQQSSPIWLVGEAPGEEEDKSGQPFKGPAGWRLDLGLREVGLVRSLLWITNLFKQRPPKNDPSYFFRDTELRYLTDEGMQHVEILKAELETWKPNIIVALGAHALFLLTGKGRGNDSISKWRGTVLPCTLVPGLKVYGTYHPSYINRMMDEKEGKRGGKKNERAAQNLYPIFLQDLRRAKAQSLFPEIRVPVRSHILPKRVGEVLSFIESIPAGANYSLDIENLINCPVITRVGLSYSPDHGISIPFVWNNGGYWTPGELALILQALSALVLRKDVTCVIQNTMHDVLILGYLWKMRFANIEDTMALQHATYPHLPKSLDFMTSVYTWEPYYKDEGKQFGLRVGNEALSIYNSKDACVTREIYPILVQEARANGTYEGYKRTMSYLPSLVAMGLRGVRADVGKMQETKIAFGERERAIDEEIEKRMGKSYKISTAQTKDLLQLLYYDMKLEVKRNKEGEITTEDDALLRLIRENPSNPILPLIREKRKLMKLRTTYLEMELPDGRFHTAYNHSVAVTWRLSSSEFPFLGGGNLQNVPKRGDPTSGLDYGKQIRLHYVADPGKVLLAADLKQAEAMYVATAAQEDVELVCFKGGGDVHWVNSQAIWPDLLNRAYDKKDGILYTRRDAGKTIKHAGNYDMGPIQLQRVLLKNGYFYTIEECKLFLLRIRSARTKTEQWKDRTRAKIDTDRTLITPLGRKRVFYGRKGGSLYRAALAFCPQSTVGEIVCMAIRDCYNELDLASLAKEAATSAIRSLGLEVLMNVHDEIVTQVEPSTYRDAAVEIKRRMEREIFVEGYSLTIPCDFKVGESWGNMEEFDL